jgi:hypothetical protein
VPVRPPATAHRFPSDDAGAAPAPYCECMSKVTVRFESADASGTHELSYDVKDLAGYQRAVATGQHGRIIANSDSLIRGHIGEDFRHVSTVVDGVVQTDAAPAPA